MPAPTDIFAQWKVWQSRNPELDDSKLEIQLCYSGNFWGHFAEKDLYGPFHEFHNLDELSAIFNCAPIRPSTDSISY